MNSLIEKKDDKRLAFVFFWILFGIFLTNATSVLSEILNISSSLVSNVSKAIILFFLVTNVFVFLKRTDMKSIIFYAFIAIPFSVNFIFNNDESGFTLLLPQFFVTVLPIIILTFSINDYESLLDVLIKFCPIIIILSVIMLAIKGESKTNEYYMGFANSLVLPIFASLYAFFRKGKRIMLVFALLGIFSVLSLGSRGALLAIACYFVVMLIKNFLATKTPFLTIGILVVSVLAIVYFDSLIIFLNDFFLSIGFRSRTLGSLLSEEISLSGRDYIYSTIINAIWEKPLAINGIGGEYVIVGTYAHNFALELVYQFGFIFGGVAVVAVVINSIKTLFAAEKSPYNDILLIAFSSSIPILLVSNSIWRAPYFWMWIVLCFKGASFETKPSFSEEHEKTLKQ